MSYEMYWNPPQDTTPLEDRILKRLKRHRKLFAFLRQHRHELLDDDLQNELIELYRNTGAGKPPHPPAQMLMALILQVYTGVADHEAVELTIDSRRWQMVLDRLDAEAPLFSVSVLHDFRMRLMVAGIGPRILERTVELARETGGFNERALRAAFDSSPLAGAGRVEDTVNLLAHAARQVLEAAALMVNQTVAEVIDRIGLSLFNDASSLKATLDVDWSDKTERHEALQRLHQEILTLQTWLTNHLPTRVVKPPLKEALETLERLMDQDLEPDPEGGGVTIRQGVATNRQISLSDPEMRHGRKSKSRRFDGYKRHVMRDIDEQLVISAVATPGNAHDSTAMGSLLDDAENEDRELVSIHIDRGYLCAPEVADLLEQNVKVFCRAPAVGAKTGMFSKLDFEIDLEAGTITCPALRTVTFQDVGSTVEFPEQHCARCPLREHCTSRRRGGRTVKIHEQEALHQTLREREKTREGRAALRQRVDVEHALAHVSQRQGNRARFRGVEKNTFHLQLVCAVQNLHRALALAQEQEGLSQVA